MTTSTVEPTVQWSQDQMVEVTLNEPDDFLKSKRNSHKNWSSIQKGKKLYIKVAISCINKEDII